MDSISCSSKEAQHGIKQNGHIQRQCKMKYYDGNQTLTSWQSEGLEDFGVDE